MTDLGTGLPFVATRPLFARHLPSAGDGGHARHSLLASEPGADQVGAGLDRLKRKPLLPLQPPSPPVTLAPDRGTMGVPVRTVGADSAASALRVGSAQRAAWEYGRREPALAGARALRQEGHTR